MYKQTFDVTIISPKNIGKIGLLEAIRSHLSKEEWPYVDVLHVHTDKFLPKTEQPIVAPREFVPGEFVG